MELVEASTGANETPEPGPMAEFPRDARPWSDLIRDAIEHFRDWQERCDNIEKLYANLKHMATVKPDREFQMFWANMEVIRPSLYSRPPVPVVMPRFRERRELVSKAAEVAERCLISSFEMGDIDDALKMARDDLAICGRGAAWLRYEAQDDGEGGAIETVSYDHVDRHDFLHEPARKWKEVGWVARRAYLTAAQGRERFGDDFLQAQFSERKDKDGNKFGGERKAEVWEIWSKTEQAVVWISPGLPNILDVREPILTLEGFFPCPKPAFATLQRGSLIPVPDFLYYRDQLEEINELTGRIAALCESLRMKGFYTAGDTELSTAIEKVFKDKDQGSVLVPISAAAGFTGGGLKDSIIWLPVVEIAQTIQQLLMNRKQLIEDVYEITGLSDIMRGSTAASETATAQQLKAQFGSVRIRERQTEMVRIARDMSRIAGEIIAENFAPQSLLEMSQVQLPTAADVQAMMQQAMMQAQAQGQPPQPPGKMPVTIEQVDALLKSQRMRPFILEIETDSTIQPDEDAEKQRRTEFLTAIGGFLQQAFPLVQAVPESAAMITESLKFAAAGFRAGRQLEGVIDEFAETIKQKAATPPQPQPDPAMERVKLDAEKGKAELGMKQSEIQMTVQMKSAELQLKERELSLKEQELGLKAQEIDAKMAMERETRDLQMRAQENARSADHGLKRELAFAKVRSSRMQPGELDGEGAVSDADLGKPLDDEIAQIQEAVGIIPQMAQMMMQLGDMIAQMQAQASAPRSVIYGPDGRVAGVQIGNQMRPVKRDGAGRVSTLQ